LLVNRPSESRARRVEPLLPPLLLRLLLLELARPRLPPRLLLDPELLLLVAIFEYL
jgi:hypothetical protein